MFCDIYPFVLIMSIFTIWVHYVHCFSVVPLTFSPSLCEPNCSAVGFILLPAAPFRQCLSPNPTSWNVLPSPSKTCRHMSSRSTQSRYPYPFWHHTLRKPNIMLRSPSYTTRVWHPKITCQDKPLL